jgi:AmmeMemoRadiSam system protein B/AmmeMemoRadiSam system protein A
MKTRLMLLLVLTALFACGPAPPADREASTTLTTRLGAASTFASPSAAISATGGPYVHKVQGAGSWYPADAGRLQAAVNAYVEQADFVTLSGRLLAVIVPHAGYVYSGGVAGFSFRALRDAGCANHVIAVIGDTHTGNGSAQIAVWAEGAFETPLGSITVDETVARALIDADDRIQFDRAAFTDEHPVENQLPFIQTVCPGARIVPVVIRRASMDNARILADALTAAMADRQALIVASTDLSHYHPYAEAQALDAVAVQAITSLDPQKVADSPQRCTELGLGGSAPQTMCSQGAVMTAIVAAKSMGANRATLLHYANSGDVPIGERDQVVGYAAVALWASQDGLAVPTSQPDPELTVDVVVEGSEEALPLSPQARHELLGLVRQTLTQFLSTETFPAFQTADPALLQPRGAYVTYEEQGQLRGCLGRIEADRPTFLNVQYAAVAAALADPRFPPIDLIELEDLTVEITLLGPVEPVDDPGQIEIGRHGILMRVGEDKAALFLPQVPLEQGWDLETTLLNLSRKAGLADDAWQRDDARFFVLTGQWFGEDE